MKNSDVDIHEKFPPLSHLNSGRAKGMEVRGWMQPPLAYIYFRSSFSEFRNKKIALHLSLAKN